ncbi:MAG: serine/threonine protein phosphatase [Gammaproteobacteria bacterium]|nr:MAG: serine/threonine protein phosphatase [Gammaproteobacteria bacterium]
MRLLVFSDLHLEFGPIELPPLDCDVVVAAGDIDVGTRAVPFLDALGKPVIYVAGNHEYWGGELSASVAALRAACRGTRVHFLERNQVTIGGVTFYGCTLWTDFGRDAEAIALGRELMNDFEWIRVGERLFTPEDMVTEHEAARRWLGKALGRRRGGRRVVVTHHAPSLRSWGFGPDDPLRYAYCNRLDEWLAGRDIDLWIHGHVHHPSDYTILDTRVVCNPRGYFGRRLVEGFDAAKIVSV